MKNKKLTDLLFMGGICVIIVGILLGTVLGFVTGGGGFNILPAFVTWLICLVTGTGMITISGSLSEVGEKKKNDDEMLRMILEKVKNEEE